jgi:hypothetical protein
LALAGEAVWDGHYYDFGARRIAAGHGYSDDLATPTGPLWHPWCHYPVGYSAFLAIFYRLFGSSHAVAGVANALVGAALAVVTWAVAAQALTRTRARIAGVIIALHPGLITYAALVMSEPLAALVTLAAFWATVRDARPLRGLVVGGVVLGLAALVRPQALLCAPFLGWVNRWRLGARALAAALACAAALVVVLPWTARNCIVMDGCALVSTNAGWNLAIGAFPRATGRFETLRSSDGCRDVTGQVQQDRCWFSYGLEQIRTRPWHWIRLVPAKLGFTFDHESFPIEYLREARPAAWPDARRSAARGAMTFAHRLLVATAAFGCVAFPWNARMRGAAVQGALLVAAGALVALAFGSDRPAFWPLAAFVAIVPWLSLPGRPAFGPPMLFAAALLGTTLATHAVFFGEDRYHMVTTPVLAIFAAAALRKCAGRNVSSPAMIPSIA